jgi:hypothetical protein
MRKQVHKIAAILGIFLGLAAAGVQAQTPSKVEVNIPFQFSAGKTTLKPGVYSIDRMSGNLLRLRTTDGKSAVILNAPVTHSSTDSEAGERLVFNKYGDQYFLSQIWLSVDSGRQVWTETKAEKPERIELSLRMK